MNTIKLTNLFKVCIIPVVTFVLIKAMKLCFFIMLIPHYVWLVLDDSKISTLEFVVFNEMSHILKQTCSFQQQVC